MKAENAQGGGRPTEPVRPQQNPHVVHHTTTTTSPAVTLDWIKFDFEYFKSIPGILKIVQFVSFCTNHALIDHIISSQVRTTTLHL